jgi:isocitrate dehydrogenase (NAD+)
MKSYSVCLIPGDGIGPEVTSAAMKVVEAAGINIFWHFATAGGAALEKEGSPLPESTIETIRKCRVALKGPTATPIGQGYSSVNVELRERFGLYANHRPIRSFIGVKSHYSDVDLVIFRENLEDFYIGDEEYVNDSRSAAVAKSLITAAGSRRIFEHAFAHAQKYGRKKITAVHKANILKMTHGIFLEAGKAVAQTYPDIEYSDRIADNMCMQLVLNPNQFEVIVAPNFLGDLLSDLCAGLVGGLGLAPGANIGNNAAIFEAVHGTAPDIAGQDKANPSALILSAAMMLDYLGEQEAAVRIQSAVAEVISEGKSVTRDINRENGVGTLQMTAAIIDKIRGHE